MKAAIKDGQLDDGPILYQCLFNNTPITRADIERTADAFLAAFAR